MALARIIPWKHSHKKLEQDLEHITQEMYGRNKELADTNRTLSLLRTIDSLVLESHGSVKAVAAQITEAIAGSTDYPLVSIYGPSSIGADKLEVYGLSTRGGLIIAKELVDDVKLDSKQQWYGNGEKSQVISISSVTPKELASYLGCSSVTAEKLKILSIQSAYVAKLVVRQKLVGVLLVGSAGQVTDFEAPDRDLLDRLSEAVGLALDNKLLFEENQQVLQQIQKANTRLKELDNTKDEFISMASHQLRTPLTTIKGYLSMVLEGDAGPVTADERKMIQNAFDGAEKMVYLIADLLNVSRLQSGKFVIDNKATDLAKMVESEVNLLKDTAEKRHQKLTLRKPDSLPLFNLDETKIRQVVMNFLDNAIYYTPTGGIIEAELTLTDETIDYTVTDNGLGVPEAEKSHLFSKFYRAGNAKKARPDGTGIGLYMAKKVIDAQGGSIIFKSKEGMGSIFGFSFPRGKVEIKENSPPKATPEAAPAPPLEVTPTHEAVAK